MVIKRFHGLMGCLAPRPRPTLRPLCVQRSLFGLCHRLRRLLEGVLEPGGGALTACPVMNVHSGRLGAGGAVQPPKVVREAWATRLNLVRLVFGGRR